MKNFSFIILFLIINACSESKSNYDASGTFEAQEVIISSEATGTIKQFDIEEGQTLTAGKFIGYIDSTQLYLKKKQLEAQMKAVLIKRPDVSLQLASLEEQLRNAKVEQARFTNLVKDSTVPQKQLDDINSQVEVLKKQIEAQRSSLRISSEGIGQESLPIQAQIEQVSDQLNKCRIINPVNGTVLTKYAEANEISTPGKPLYKIADLTTIILRAYVTGDQLPKIKLNQVVNVSTDEREGKMKQVQGTITWISDKSEFTPKGIQTKDERANLVYAVKISVKNDGYLKIGMYGEVKF